MISIASSRQVHTISRIVCMGCERPGGPGRVSTPVWHAAPSSLGMSPDCRKLGLGVQEISIAAGTWADVMAGGAVILRYHSIPVYVYIN